MAKKKKRAKKKATKKKATKRVSVAQRAERKARAAVNVCGHLATATRSIEDAVQDLRTMGVAQRYITQARAAKSKLESLLKNCVVR